MSIKIYERLSKFYDSLWGELSKSYLPLLQDLLVRRNIQFARILDLGCGSGTLAVELGRKGHVVFGLDISPAMIKFAKQKGLIYDDVKFKVHDMKTFRFKTPFDLIISTIDSMNYLSEKEAIQDFVDSVSHSLKPGGLFVFDVSTETMYMKNNGAVFTHALNGDTFIQRLSYDNRNERATALFEFPDGGIEVHHLKAFEFPRIKKILYQNRLKLIHSFSSVNYKQYTQGDERLICVAEKK